MATTAVREPLRGLTFEDVWAALMENREQQKETRLQMQETDRRMQETDRRLKKTEKLVKETSKRMGDLHNRFGELAEHLVAPGIADRFNELGYRFDSIAPGGHRILGPDGKVRAEVDILLENSEYILAVEVKTRPREKDIERHIKRLEIIREHRNKHRDGRKLRGAIAGAIFGMAEKETALEAGLYVLEQSGDTMRMDLPEGFVPQEW